MRFLRPLPSSLSRLSAPIILGVWVVQMGFLLRSVEREAHGASLAADLARYGSSAQWRGIYLRGEKIGFSVTQTSPLGDGYEIEEDGRLRMLLLGMTTVTRLRSVARVDHEFALNSFSFSLDPGTGAVEISGRVDGRRLLLSFHTSSGTREEVRDLPERPALSLNLTRQLVSAGLKTGRRFEVSLIDPTTLTNAPATIEVVGHDVLFIEGRPVPTYRLTSRFVGLESTMWVTETGEVVREESPLGMVVVKESPRKATLLGVLSSGSSDLVNIASVVPKSAFRIPDPTAVQRLRIRLEGADALLGRPDAVGAGQSLVAPDVLEVQQVSQLEPQPLDPARLHFVAAEPLVESDDPAIRAEAEKAVAGTTGARARAERLVRHVYAMLDKRPTVSLPSAAEVLRTRVGDCNEHTVLYVALARAVGLPARVAVGLVYLLGAFHYHAWAEVYVEDPPGRGSWIPVDPTFNQFPADATHVRLARGGLEQQALITPLIGRIRIEILDLALRPGAEPPVVGRAQQDMHPIEIAMPHRDAGGPTCWGH